MFLLDTNVVSELRSQRKSDALVLQWSRSVPADEQWLSVMSLMEIEIGILRVKRKDPPQSDRLRVWLETIVVPMFGDRLLPIDAAIVRQCAALHVPNTRPERDALIAATALVHGLTVVTRNTKDFQPMGVPVVDPWQHSTP
jgi:hypothetical protein